MKQKTGSFFEFALALSAVSLCFALTVGNGVLYRDARDAISVALLSFSFLTCLAALFFADKNLPGFARVPLVRIAARAPVFTLLCVALSMELLFLMLRYPDFLPLFVIAFLFAAFGFALMRENDLHWTRNRAISAGALWLLFVFCGACVLFFIRRELSDIIIFQRDAVRALLSGTNPYSITFPNIYGPKTPYYGAGTVVDGRVMFGFPYPPPSLLWVAPAQTIAGDFRYAHLLALAIGAAFVAALGASRVTLCAALLMVFCAPAFFVLEVGWTEPVSIMILCACVWTAMRKTRATAALTGLLAVSKQYLIFALPLMFLLPRESDASTRASRRNDFFVAFGAALLVTLPFFLWNPRAFVNSLLVLHLKQVVRLDSLSYIAYLKLIGGPQLPTWLGFVAAIVTVVFCSKRAPKTAGGFAASVALVHFAFFILGKQAFCNYYYFVFAALCCATAAAHIENKRDVAI